MFRRLPTGQNIIAQDEVKRRRNAILGMGENEPQALKGRHNLSRPFRAWDFTGALPGFYPRLLHHVPLGLKSEKISVDQEEKLINFGERT